MNKSKTDHIEEELEKLIEWRDIMRKYAQMMLERNDTHGVWDAAIDISKLDEKIEWLKKWREK